MSDINCVYIVVLIEKNYKIVYNVIYGNKKFCK